MTIQTYEVLKQSGDVKKNTKKKIKICLISSSGGHYEQLSMLKTLGEKHDVFWVTEKTGYKVDAKYYLTQTGSQDFLFPIKMFGNCFKTLYFWHREKPELVITTGTLIALPVCLLAKILRRKVIFIETFARVTDCTRTGKLMYKIADMFIYQWEQLAKFYPNGVYGGSIY